MAGLNKQDMEILGHYAKKGNRELYWNYLAQTPGNDGYGLLALGVVRNDNMPGALANQYAQNQAQSVNGVRLSERQWDRFGQDLMQRDFTTREAHFEQGRPAQALNLPVPDVQKAHDDAFGNAGITPDAWTPRPLLEAARRQGGEPAAEGVWQTMLDSKALGTRRLVSTLADTAYHYNDEGLDAARYTGRLTLATAQASQTLPNTDPNRLGTSLYHHAYDAREGAWYTVNTAATGMGSWNAVQRVTQADRIRELDDARALRLEVQERAKDFHPLDPHRTLARSPRTLADAGESLPPETPRLAANNTRELDALFERLTHAAMNKDTDGMRTATRDYTASQDGQAWLQSGQSYNQTLQAQAQAKTQVQAQGQPAQPDSYNMPPQRAIAHEAPVRSL